MITFIESFKRELESEAAQTRRMLAIVPADKMDWQPHTKSMKLKPLASHLAEMPLMIASPVGLYQQSLSSSRYEDG